MSNFQLYIDFIISYCKYILKYFILIAFKRRNKWFCLFKEYTDFQKAILYSCKRKKDELIMTPTHACLLTCT